MKWGMFLIAFGIFMGVFFLVIPIVVALTDSSVDLYSFFGLLIGRAIIPVGLPLFFGIRRYRKFRKLEGER